MLFREILLPGVLLPAAAALAVYLTSWLLDRQVPSRHTGDGLSSRALISGGVAVGLAYLVAHAAISGLPPLPAVEATEWLFHGVGVGVLLTLFVPALPRFELLLGAWIVLFGGLSWVSSDSMRAYRWEGAQVWLWLILLVIVGLALALVARGLGLRDSRHLAPLVWIVAAGAAALTVGLSGSARLAQLCGATAVALGVGWLFGLWSRWPPLERGGATVAALTLWGIVMNGYFFAELTAVNASLLLAAPASGWLVHRVVPRERLRLPLALATVVVLCGVAVGTAAWQARAEAADDPYSDWAALGPSLEAERAARPERLRASS